MTILSVLVSVFKRLIFCQTTDPVRLIIILPPQLDLQSCIFALTYLSIFISQYFQVFLFIFYFLIPIVHAIGYSTCVMVILITVIFFKPLLLIVLRSPDYLLYKCSIAYIIQI